MSGIEISTGEAVLFWILGPASVFLALALVFVRRTVHIAVAMVGVMVSLAVMYILNEATFLGVAQVVVYTGAVMMLFLFVIMLVGVDNTESLKENLAGQRWIAGLCGLGLVILLTTAITRAALPPAAGLAAANADTNPVGVARLIFGDFVFAFELTGALLITAAIGAITLTHRARLGRKVGQRETAEAKMASYGAGGSSEVVTPTPGPGIYARHNSADMPALDPYGNPVESSITTVLRVRGQEHSLPEDEEPLALEEAAASETKEVEA